MLSGVTVPWQVWTIIMDKVQQLEPRIQNFLEGFPCPPPWKQDLIFSLNWTNCIGTEMGQRARMYMMDKCNIRTGIMVEQEDDCGLACPEIIVSITTALVIILIAVLFILYCARRKRAKAASPSHQSSLTAHADGNAKYYTSCHYASTPVRQLQTNLTENGTETLVVNESDSNSLYTPGCYPQHNCQSPMNYGLNPPLGHHASPFHQQQHHHHHHHHPHHPHYHHPQHPHHQQQPIRYVNTKYGPVPAHTSSLIVPQNSRYNISHYRKFDPVYSSSSVTNSDRSPVYESIGDNDSIRERTRNGSECEFCECGLERCNMDPGFYSGYMDLEPRPTSESDTYTDKIGTSGYPPDIEPPCPPLLCTDGFYDDRRRSQTLPLRPIRGHPPPTTNNNNNNINNGGATGNNSVNNPSTDNNLIPNDSDELSPLNHHAQNQQQPQHQHHHHHPQQQQQPQQQQEEPLLMSLSSPTSVKNGLTRTISNEPQFSENNSSSSSGVSSGINGNGNNNNNHPDLRVGARRRPSSTSSQYAEGSALSNNGAPRRPIPALHPNYFSPNGSDEIS